MNPNIKNNINKNKKNEQNLKKNNKRSGSQDQGVKGNKKNIVKNNNNNSSKKEKPFINATCAYGNYFDPPLQKGGISKLDIYKKIMEA